MTIKVIYGSSLGNTEFAAERIGELLGVEIEEVSQVSTEDFEAADLLVLGSSTWSTGNLQDDWEAAIELLEAADLSAKKVAIFGMGDQDSYPDTFVDAMGILYTIVIERGATVIGKTSTEGYEFEESQAVVDGEFVGLALDEENQSDLHDERIEAWVELLKSEIA